MRYIAVFHEFFMKGGSFDVQEVLAKSKDEADTIAAAESKKRSKTFNECEYTVIEISDQQRLVKRSWLGRAYIQEVGHESKALPM